MSEEKEIQEKIDHAARFLLDYYVGRTAWLNRSLSLIERNIIIEPDIFIYGEYDDFFCANYAGINSNDYHTDVVYRRHNEYFENYKLSDENTLSNLCEKCILKKYCRISSEEYKLYYEENSKCSVCHKTIHNRLLLYMIYSINRKITNKNVEVQNALCCNCFKSQDKIENFKMYLGKVLNTGCNSFDDIKEMVARYVQRKF